MNCGTKSHVNVWITARDLTFKTLSKRTKLRCVAFMATLVMPLLGAIAGFGVHRQGVLLVRAITGSVIGFTYFVAENLSLALGKLGVIPAIIGAFFPLALFMVVGFAILLAMEN